MKLTTMILLGLGASGMVLPGLGAEGDELKDGLYAKFDTSKGEILLALEFEKTPMTVCNFVGLAEGKMENKERAGVPYYDGLKFHRVIKDFMVQGGCPEGTGRGGPGYQFPDEFDPSLRHSGPGILSMANAGPGTNGSQFFITHKETPWLDDRHTVFGHVVSGQSVVDAIQQDDVIKKLTIVRVGEKAKAFKADQATFNDLRKNIKSPAEANLAKAKEFIEETKKKDGVKTTPSGLCYKILQEGAGANPKATDKVTVHYEGRLIDGKVFDSSIKRNSPATFPLNQVIPGWTEGLQLVKEGGKIQLYIPPELGYGSRGAANVIPPNAALVFDVELIKIN